MADLRSPLTEGPSVGKREDIKTRTSLGGSAVESIMGAAAVVLAVIGLAGMYPVMLASIAAICVGAALLFEGLALGAHYYDENRHNVRGELEVGEIGVEAMAGIAGIVLGILALVDAVSPWTLLPIAALVMGGGLIFGTGALAVATRQRFFDAPGTTNDKTEQMTRVAQGTAPGAHAFAGVASVVLGIIALVVMSTMAMSLVAFLVMGATLLLSSAAVGGRMLAAFRR